MVVYMVMVVVMIGVRSRRRSWKTHFFPLYPEGSVFSIYHILSSSEDKTHLILQNN